MKSNLSSPHTKRPIYLQPTDRSDFNTLSLTHTATFTVQCYTGREVCVSHFPVKLSDVKEVVHTHTRAHKNSVSEKYF